MGSSAGGSGAAAGSAGAAGTPAAGAGAAAGPAGVASSTAAGPAGSASSTAAGVPLSGRPDEPLTEELLARLLASTTPEQYLDEAPVVDRDLSAYLMLLLNAHGITRAAAIRASGVNATFGYQIFQGTRRPGRDTAIAVAFGLGATLRETQRLLRVAGYSELYCKVRRDAIIILCLQNGLSRFECDDELFRLGEPTLAGETGQVAR